MKTPRSLFALTAVNLALLLLAVAQYWRPAFAQAASGLSFAGPTGTKDTYLILEASGTSSSLKLRNENGREQILRP